MLTARKHRPLSEPDRTVSCRACRPPHPVMLPQSGCSRLRYPRGSGLGQRRSISFSAGRASRCRREIRRTKVSYQCVCVCVCFLPIHYGHQVRWTYQPRSHRRKVTPNFPSTLLLRCVPSFFSREGFSHSFRSSTVKSNFVY